MNVNFGLFVLLVTYSSACVNVFGARNKNIKKRSQSPWYEDRANHVGLGLTDIDLEKLSALGDENHFNRVLQPILIPRVVDTPGHAQVRKFIIDQMESLGWTIEQHQFKEDTPVGLKTFTNVISTLNPTATRHLVLACHYDSKLTPTGFLGAIDSAVPCAMLINLAHTLKASLDKHKISNSDITLRFLFIDGEEAFKTWNAKDSLYGARNLAQKLHNTNFPSGGHIVTTELDRIDLFVLLDLLGTEDVGFYSLYSESESWYARTASFEKRLMDKNLINRRTRMFREQSYYNAGIEDDHVPFLQKGVPIFHVISAPFPKVWHKMSDNLSSLHPPSIQNLNTIFRAFVVDYLHLEL